MGMLITMGEYAIQQITLQRHLLCLIEKFSISFNELPKDEYETLARNLYAFYYWQSSNINSILDTLTGPMRDSTQDALNQIASNMTKFLGPPGGTNAYLAIMKTTATSSKVDYTLYMKPYVQQLLDTCLQIPGLFGAVGREIPKVYGFALNLFLSCGDAVWAMASLITGLIL